MKKQKRIIVLVVFILAIVALAVVEADFIRARYTSARAPCINNLRQIDGAKAQWALENKKADTDIPALDDVRFYMKDNTMPKCPNGGIYILGKVGEDPRCSIGGYEHSLPSP